MPATRKTPGKTRKYLIAAVAAIALAFAVVACASRSAAPARAAATQAVPITQCQGGNVTPACAAWQDTNTNTGPCIQDLQLTDHNGAPIWWVNNCGGMWVGNDKLGVTGSSVFNNAIYMWVPDSTHGALVIDGQTLTASNIAFIVCLQKAGATLSSCRLTAAKVK